MDDAELFEWFGYACVTWARTNGDADASFDDFKLSDPGTGVIAISAWTSTAPQPTDVQLKAVGVPACQATKDMYELLAYMEPDYTLVNATQAQIDAIVAPPQGAIVLNTTIAAVQVYLGIGWVSVTPAEFDIVFPRVVMAPGGAGSAPSAITASASPRHPVKA